MLKTMPLLMVRCQKCGEGWTSDIIGFAKPEYISRAVVKFDEKHRESCYGEIIEEPAPRMFPQPIVCPPGTEEVRNKAYCEMIRNTPHPDGPDTTMTLEYFEAVRDGSVAKWTKTFIDGLHESEKKK